MKAAPAARRPAAGRKRAEDPRRPERSAGFSLIEMAIALTLLILAAALAAELLGESQEMVVDSARQSLDAPAGLVADQFRADVQGAALAVPAQNPAGGCIALTLSGGAQGTITYQLVAGALTRTDLALAKAPTRTLLSGALTFNCQVVVGVDTDPVVRIDYTYLRSRVRRSPLALVPGVWAPKQEVASETLFLTPRGGGLGETW